MRTPRKLRAVLALLLLTGCAEVGKLAASVVVPPKLTFRSVNVRDLDLEGATLAFDFDVQNENGFGLSVARIAYALDVEGTRLDGTAPGGLKLPARAKAPLTLTAHLRYRDLPTLAALVGKKDAVRYKLSGNVGVETPLGVLDLPVSHEDRLDLPRLPQLALDGVSVRSVSLTRLSLEVRVRMTNPNAFPLPAGHLDAALSLGGAEVARVDERTLAAVPGKASAVAAIPISLDLGDAGRAALDLSRGAPVQVNLRGEARVGGLTLPLSLAEKLVAR
jgi:LEA14-like dessication related protein